MKNLILLVSYLFIISSACYAQDLGWLREGELIDDEQKQRLERLNLMELRFGKEECQRGFFVHYRKNESDEWIVSSISRSQSKIANLGEEEILIFSDDLKCVMTGYEDKPDPGKSKRFMYACDKGLFSKRGRIYNPCTSSLSVTLVDAGSLS